MGVSKNETGGRRPLFAVLRSPDGGTRRSLQVQEKELLLGRALSNDVVLVDTRVSKHHAKIWFMDGKHYVQDLGSRNGTRLNGVLIGAGKPVEVEEGDVLTLGSQEVTLSTEPVMEPRAPAREEPLSPSGWDELATQISEEQAGLVREIVRSSDPQSAFAEFCGRYVSQPLALVRLENRLICRRLSPHGADVRPEDVPKGVLDGLLALNALVERLCHPEPERPKDVNSQTYAALQNVEFLLHGDIVPGPLWRLEEPAGFANTVPVAARKLGAPWLDLLRTSRAIGICQQAAVAAGKGELAAEQIFGLCGRFSSADAEGETDSSGGREPARASREGGGAPQRAMVLQLMLQETGIRSRYVRGILLGGSDHAWAELSLSGGEDFAWLMDPSLGLFARKGEAKRLGQWGGEPLQTFPLGEARALGGARTEDRVYGVVEGIFNTLWRARRRWEPKGSE